MKRFPIGEGRLKIEVCDLGARLNAVSFDRLDGLLDGVATREEALGAKKFNGAVVGPVANRIAGATAEIDGQTFHFEANENGTTTLHSGAGGVHAQDWSVGLHEPDYLRLHLDLTGGAGGFPGNRKLTAHYAVVKDMLKVVLEAESDAHTWINLALHPYWTLNQTGRAGQKVEVKADHYTPVDDMKIPTGEIADVSGTRFDLRMLDVPSDDIDHNFCLKLQADGFRDPAFLVMADNGVTMDVDTNVPGLQIYSGKPTGIAIEPQHWPDAMHHPAFPRISLRPNGSYRQETTYQFSRA